MIVTLTGGISGAKLCYGLQRVLTPGTLHVVVNTADDFEHLGLRICPDIDTTVYTLAHLSNAEDGRGRRDETYSFMMALRKLQGESWYRIGDGELALQLERTRRLANGETLSAVTLDIARKLEVKTQVLPMSDDRVQMLLNTAGGDLHFHDYYLRQQYVPTVLGVRLQHVSNAQTSPGVRGWLLDPALRAIVIAPANPYLSMDPMLAIPGMRASLRAAGVPIIAVTPILSEFARGPTVKIMKDLGLVPSPFAVIEHYRDLVDALVLDVRDDALLPLIEVPVRICNTLMSNPSDCERVAREVLQQLSELERTDTSKRGRRADESTLQGLIKRLA